VPELPEVETVRRGLNQVTLNQPILGGDVLLDRTIASPSPSEFLDGLQGGAIAQWHRRGKYLLAELSLCASDRQDGSGDILGVQSNAPVDSLGVQPNASTDILGVQPRGFAVAARAAPTGHPPIHPSTHPPFLGVHLRMTGQLLWLHQSDPLQKHTRVRLFFPDNRELRFVDQRTFGQMWWVPPGHPPESIITGLQLLGPEPLSPDFTLAYFTEKLNHRLRPIKNALLDQAIVAGIGNIYADEALFLSQIRPQTLCAKLKPRQIARLHSAILQVLETAINARGTTFSDFRDVEGTNGNYGGVAWVYDREGEACRVCGNPIERLKMAGRSAHFCRKCQK
jgi:formamidopyrimidine-DNA glycosylase